MTRRQVLKAGMIGGAGMMLPLRFLPAKAWASPGSQACEILTALGENCTNLNLSDPFTQPKFEQIVPDALAPSFKYKPDMMGRYKIKIGTAIQQTGLRAGGTGSLLNTPVWGYGDYFDQVYTWPGRTFEIQSKSAGGLDETEVFWTNNLDPRVVGQHLLPVDTSLHWCFSLPGYTNKTIARNGVPIITHLHGGHTDWPWDGNPEFFYTYNDRVKGPQWRNVPGGFTNKFTYDNDIFAGNLWYHDHALGITRLNVYAGLAGFYFVRDEYDTGEPGNPLNLPAWPYEKAYAIQDRMFYDDGRLFYPAFPGDPYYDGFITGEGAVLPEEIFPGGGPTALAEFFGDHMVVNGKIWPKEEVEPRYYRMHLLNGTDSRFMAIQFVQVPLNVTDFSSQIGGPLQFHVIGSDQGLGDEIKNVNMLLLEPGSRYDIIFNFRNRSGQRIIMKNIGGDQPFGGDLVTDDLSLQVFECTDRIMAFDVNKPLHHFTAVADLPNQDLVRPTNNEIDFGPRIEDLGNHRTRKVALFEGTDEFGRLQPLLGTAEPATDYEDQPINWPDEEPYISAGLIGQMEGSIAWHSPTTENPALYSTETWEIYNATGDAHPIHLHLVHFKVLNRQDVILATEDQAVVQHNGAIGNGSKITNIELQGNPITTPPDGYVENTPKDMVTALPGQVTRILVTFDKPGRYVWHCHILSHEDHEMMRVLHVGPGAQ